MSLLLRPPVSPQCPHSGGGSAGVALPFRLPCSSTVSCSLPLCPPGAQASHFLRKAGTCKSPHHPTGMGSPVFRALISSPATSCAVQGAPISQQKRLRLREVGALFQPEEEPRSDSRTPRPVFRVSELGHAPLFTGLGSQGGSGQGLNPQLQGGAPCPEYIQSEWNATSSLICLQAPSTSRGIPGGRITPGSLLGLKHRPGVDTRAPLLQVPLNMNSPKGAMGFLE